MTVAAQLTRALERQGIPIAGVSIGREDDRTTWRIDYTAAATAGQRTTAEALKLSYNPATDTAFVDEQATGDLEGQKALKAVVVWCAQKFSLTPAQARAELVAIYKALP